jgi:hypothetical protein
MKPNDLITLQFRSEEASDASSESNLKQYLGETFEVKIQQEFVESVHWPLSTLFLAPAAVPVVKYAGKKLVDVLVDSLRAWLQRNPKIPEIVLYGADGKIISRVSRKNDV